MKIAYYHYTMVKMGGVERIFTEKMNYLADIYGYDVFLITLYQGNHPLYYELSSKVKHIDLGIRSHTIYTKPRYQRPFLEYQYNELIRQKFQEIITEINPDIISAVAGQHTSFILNIQTKAKIIMESHQARYYTGMDRPRFNPVQMIKNVMQKHTMKKIEKKCDAIVTLTKDDAKSWNKKKTFVIPNIVTQKTSCISTNTNKNVIAAGRLVYQKGFDKLIDAWDIVSASKKDWNLNIFGEGELYNDLQKKIMLYKLSNSIKIHQPTENIETEFTQSSIFVLSSRYEGFGLVLVEAMQCGVPCISFDCPHGPSDIIDNGINGILVKNGDIEEFANAILKLIDDEELRIKMGKAAIEKAKDYLPETIMPQWIELFNNLVIDNNK